MKLRGTVVREGIESRVESLMFMQAGMCRCLRV